MGRKVRLCNKFGNALEAKRALKALRNSAKNYAEQFTDCLSAMPDVQTRRLAALEPAGPSATQSILAAFLLLLMMLVYLFSRRVTASRKTSSRGIRIQRKKA